MATADGRSAAPADDDGGPSNRLCSEHIATRLGVDRFAAAIGHPSWSPYLLVVAVYFIDVPILSTVQYFRRGFHPYLVNPGSLTVVVFALYAVWAAIALRDAFNDTIDDLPSHDTGGVTKDLSIIRRTILWFASPRSEPDDPQRLATLANPHVKVLMVVLAWGLYVGWISTNQSIQQLILVDEGLLIGGIKYGLFIPFYLTLAAEFFVTYLGIIVFLPLNVQAIGIIDFEDPLGFAGLRPVGDLIRQASTNAYLGFGGFVAGIGINRFLAQPGYAPPMGPVTTVFIAAGIAVGVVLFVYAIMVLHGHMTHAKHETLHQIATAVKETGPPNDDEMFPETKTPSWMGVHREYVQLYIKKRTVETARDYPIDIAHLQQFVLAAIVPFVADVAVATLSP